MNAPPAYFEPVRKRAAGQWDQLERDPELAGPWHQLFKQVQSPRHILSELLQNADDAGASEAAVRIKDQVFIFTHNGEDFTEEQFSSLCRFGYSNKRALHTIGFRGIGFKSTFSVGGTVCLCTPTLSVAFEQKRFTEPRWINDCAAVKNTEIRIAISDEHREREVEKSLQDWKVSPVSLLFFRHIRRLQIGDHEMHWGSLGPGPVPNTEWMALHDNPDHAMLLLRSEPESFPHEALLEIKQERLLGDDQDAEFPPSRVEIVLSAKGRLYVVLPTGVETKLPFACNAPFIQDPARLKIKDPETSPTNRWLLERIGTLASSVMLRWLGQESESLIERSRAYGLFPDVDREDNTLEGTCAATVEQAFEEALGESPFLLTIAGKLEPPKKAVIVPEKLYEVWQEEHVSTLFDSSGRPALTRHISDTDTKKLLHWRLVEGISKEKILSVLQSTHLPKPESWGRLLRLWVYIAPEITGWRMSSTRSKLSIVPVQGKNVLYASDDVVRLGEKRLLRSDDDWELLSRHLLVLNHNWPRFLADQRRLAEDKQQNDAIEDIEAAHTVLEAIGLKEASDTGKVIERVAAAFFAQESIRLSDCVRLAQITAKLGATSGNGFLFASRDRELRSCAHVVLYERDGGLEELLPEAWCTGHLLHPDYVEKFECCTKEEWHHWISTGRAGLHTFPPLVQRESKVWGRSAIESELRKRGFKGQPHYQYVTDEFLIRDWNFDERLWHYWFVLANNDQNVWGRVGDRILAQTQGFWLNAQSARVFQFATTGNRRAVTHEPLLPGWVLRLRELPCLPDTRGFYRKPADLLRRTKKTEALIDVEPFVDHGLDTEANCPLLDLLGVGDTPTGPDRLLERLRALAKADKAPISEIEKWYRRLDQIAETCSPHDLQKIKRAFRNETLILATDGTWNRSSGVFLKSDEDDAPGAPVVRPSVAELTLWRVVEVAERPTAELAITWLHQLPSGEVLSKDDSRRVRSLIARHPQRIWDECGHWINLAGEWTPVETLAYALAMQSLVPWKHLHEWVKQRTADLQPLASEITNEPPFSSLPHLAGQIEDRFDRGSVRPGRALRMPWMSCFGSALRRARFDDPSETSRVRGLATRLVATEWCTTPNLEIIPYLDGTPAGTPRRTGVVWIGNTLYVDDLPNAKLARVVPEKLASEFGRSDVEGALHYCFDRSPEQITEYIEENFKLEAVDQAEHQVDDEFLTDDASADQNEDQSRPFDASEQVEEEPVEADEAEESSSLRNGDEADLDADRDWGELTDEGKTARQPRDQQPARPGIIERFASSQGFRKDGDERFFHSDGSWIVKISGERFPWERRTATGNLVRRYWPREHCLQKAPLQLEADIWGLIEKFPDDYALVLLDAEGNPVEVSGAQLRAMRDSEELKLYPASYRLVIERDHQR